MVIRARLIRYKFDNKPELAVMAYLDNGKAEYYRYEEFKKEFPDIEIEGDDAYLQMKAAMEKRTGRTWYPAGLEP